MDNPFIEGEYILPIVSLNKLVINKHYSLIDDDIIGKNSYDIFSTPILINEIKFNADKLKLNINNLEERFYPNYLEKALSSKDIDVKQTAEKIMEKMGKRLGLVLLTLKKGDEENRKTRPDWTSNHWNYWKTIETVYLVGGLTSGALGKHLKRHSELFLKQHNEFYDIKLSEFAQISGLVGCSSLITSKNGLNLLFDFGQSFIKRSIVEIKNNKVIKLYTLENIPSLYVSIHYENNEEEMNDANALNQYIIDTIISTVLEVKPMNLNSEIIISIANYIIDGKLCKRGGYGKLRDLYPNYEMYLNQEISSKLNKEVNITMIHDGTASAYAFSHPNALCLSLGTAFGVGFPRETNKVKIKKNINIVSL